MRRALLKCITIIAATCMASGCSNTGADAAKNLGDSVERSAAKLKDAAEAIDPVAVKKLLDQLKQANAEIEKLRQQVQDLEFEHADRVPKEVIGHYKTANNTPAHVERLSANEFRFTVGNSRTYTYHFDPKKVVFVCQEVKGSQAYYFPDSGVLAYSGFAGENPTFWKK